MEIEFDAPGGIMRRFVNVPLAQVQLGLYPLSAVVSSIASRVTHLKLSWRHLAYVAPAVTHHLRAVRSLQVCLSDARGPQDDDWFFDYDPSKHHPVNKLEYGVLERYILAAAKPNDGTCLSVVLVSESNSFTRRPVWFPAHKVLLLLYMLRAYDLAPRMALTLDWVLADDEDVQMLHSVFSEVNATLRPTFEVPTVSPPARPVSR
ncbi:hypothetical protein EXIGLDRAFT_729834 [Exidia glandulosa HHB12029]|uniref:Uncharacterized protein n=1 Tax=Exidia glandulosa HHB12029 TaxID=1314781 RepID=A0A165CEV6_EXIGL|nr:hypothetical protein EXIGLDRAFT_729834 [Exidia glandulosa HHB12029]